MSKTNKTRFTFLFIIVLTALTVMTVYPKLPDNFPGSSFFSKFTPHLGLDLQGGAHLVYEANLEAIDSLDKASSLNGARDVIEKRVNTFGVAEPVVQISGNNRIIIELAGVFDIKEAISLIGETPLLEFKEPGNQELSEEGKNEIININLEKEVLAQGILERVKNGEDFASLASEFSEDPGSKNNAGIIDFVNREVLAPEYANAIFDTLKDGEVTNELVETQYGYHIIKKLEERMSDDPIDPATATTPVREVKSQHILFMIQPLEGQFVWQNTELGGKQLKVSNVLFDNTTGNVQIGLDFDSEGKEMFAEITARNIGQPVGIFLDGDLVTMPTVNEEIRDGSAVITGSFNLNEAKEISQRLNAGALPVPVNLISQQTVGATLGQISLEKSLFAGLIGLIILALFMIIYYRLPGLLAVLALSIYASVSLAVFELIPVTLTLSGIAGFILSVGMAVDANVLIFERFKEELRDGKILSIAIEEGFQRAWTSIRDSNVSSLITCFILYAFGASMVKGFALTLGIGIFVSMFSAVVITRNFLRIMTNPKMDKYLWLFGVNKKNNLENK
jgi:protein-export membrane protein SecD